MSSIRALAPSLDALRRDNIFVGTSLSEQLAQHPCTDPASPVGARLLLKEGRPYQEAVDNFSPYEKIQEPQPAVRTAVRTAAAELIRARQTGPTQRPSYVYVNNRLEGNALGTIAAILELLGDSLRS